MAEKFGRAAQKRHGNGKPEILDDPRLEAVTDWLRQLDWFTPEPGLWGGDANESFLDSLAHTWADKPRDAEYLGNQAVPAAFPESREAQTEVDGPRAAASIGLRCAPRGKPKG
jgi:hypothetical protein